MESKMTFGLIVGTRGFFSPRLAAEGRKQLAAKLDALGYDYVIPPEDATATGAIETVADAQKCARVFHEHREEIQGIIVALPNFGDEIGVINTLRLANLDVPVLVQASDDDIDKVDVENRRDSFCGKLSVCNNLYQYDIPFTDTTYHTCAIESDVFESDIEFFAKVCRVVNGLRNARIGAIGARPGPFQTMRFSEKLLQTSGITVVTVDLSEILFAAQRLDDEASEVKGKLEEIRDYGTIPERVNEERILRQAKLSVAIENWVSENIIQAAGVQCWTSVQENYGCAACLSMSMMGEKLIPCACEVDVYGAATMLAAWGAGLARTSPHFIDWTELHPTQENVWLAWHCGNAPVSLCDTECRACINQHSIIPIRPAWGTLEFKEKTGPVTCCRLAEYDGFFSMFIGRGEVIDVAPRVRGSYAWVKVADVMDWEHKMVEHGIIHHGVLIHDPAAGDGLESFCKSLGIDVVRGV